jgi:hypothetical protein
MNKPDDKQIVCLSITVENYSRRDKKTIRQNGVTTIVDNPTCISHSFFRYPSHESLRGCVEEMPLCELAQLLRQTADEIEAELSASEAA